MYLIGITGGVGAGKSEILSYIKKHYKCKVYLADEVAHLLQKKGNECYDRLLLLLGEEILDETGEIDRKKMAARIFGDEALLDEVNRIVHPLVRKFLEEKIEEEKQKEETELFFIEAALLIEAGYDDIVDEMWYIYADADVRRQRLKQNRGYSAEKIEQIMEAQLSEKQYRDACHFVIDNSASLEDSYLQIQNKLKAYIRPGSQGMEKEQ